MTAWTVRIRAASACLAVAVSHALSAVSARADVEIAWSSDTQWVFDISHVPDLDQKRYGLANQGKSHCVPASTINWTAYFANHGRPSMAPGPGDWESQELYPAATFAVATLGALMGTTGDGGTNHTGAAAGFLAWTHGEPVVLVQVLSNDFWSPIFPSAARAVFQGGYVIICVGWYVEFPEGFILRDGGHALSLNGGARSDLNMEIGWRDPGRDEHLWSTQSPFNTETYAVQHRWMKPYNYSGNSRVMSMIVGYGNEIKQAFMDKYYVIVPGFAVTSQPDGPVIAVQRAFVAQGSPVPPYEEFASLVGERVIDLAILQDLSGFMCIVESETPGTPNELWRVDAVTGEAEPIDDASLTDPQRVVVGRYRDLFVTDGGQLVKVTLDVDPPLTTAITPPGAIGSLCYDDTTDEVVLVATDTRRLLRYPHHFDLDPVERFIPPEVPLTGRTSICRNDALDCLMFVSDGSNALWKLTELVHLVVAEPIALPGVVSPKAVQVDDRGRVYISSQQGVVEVEYLAETDDWSVVGDPHYDGLVAGDCLVVARSRSNDHPDMHYTEAWRDVPPDYCDASGDCEQQILRVRAGDIDNFSGCGDGYAYYGHLSTEIALGETLDVHVTVGDPHPLNTCAVWVDWDRDLKFDYPRDFTVAEVVGVGAWTVGITPPADAQPGPTRMRVSLAYEDWPWSCGAIGSGEIEDYTLVVVEAAHCPADVDGDGIVGFDDLLAVLSAWGLSGVPADIDGNGIVGFDDLLEVLSNWGPC